MKQRQVFILFLAFLPSILRAECKSYPSTPLYRLLEQADLSYFAGEPHHAGDLYLEVLEFCKTETHSKDAMACAIANLMVSERAFFWERDTYLSDAFQWKAQADRSEIDPVLKVAMELRFLLRGVSYESCPKITTIAKLLENAGACHASYFTALAHHYCARGTSLHEKDKAILPKKWVDRMQKESRWWKPFNYGFQPVLFYNTGFGLGVGATYWDTRIFDAAWGWENALVIGSESSLMAKTSLRYLKDLPWGAPHARVSYLRWREIYSSIPLDIRADRLASQLGWYRGFDRMGQVEVGFSYEDFTLTSFPSQENFGVYLAWDRNPTYLFSWEWFCRLKATHVFSSGFDQVWLSPGIHAFVISDLSLKLQGLVGYSASQTPFTNWFSLSTLENIPAVRPNQAVEKNLAAFWLTLEKPLVPFLSLKTSLVTASVRPDFFELQERKNYASGYAVGIVFGGRGRIRSTVELGQFDGQSNFLIYSEIGL